MKCIRILALILCLSPLVLAQETKEKNDAAVQAADSWLALVDAGKYDQCWDEASSMFKEKVTKEQWSQVMTRVREPLGKSESRKVERTTYTTKLPNAPEGEYVVVQYQSKFEKLPAAIETVIPMLDKDGKWRTSGFFIKPAE